MRFGNLELNPFARGHDEVRCRGEGVDGLLQEATPPLLLIDLFAIVFIIAGYELASI